MSIANKVDLDFDVECLKRMKTDMKFYYCLMPSTARNSAQGAHVQEAIEHLSSAIDSYAAVIEDYERQQRILNGVAK